VRIPSSFRLGEEREVEEGPAIRSAPRLTGSEVEKHRAAADQRNFGGRRSGIGEIEETLEQRARTQKAMMTIMDCASLATT